MMYLEYGMYGGMYVIRPRGLDGCQMDTRCDRQRHKDRQRQVVN